MFQTLSLRLFCIFAQGFCLSLHQGLPDFFSLFVLTSCTSVFCRFFVMSSCPVLPVFSTSSAMEVPRIQRTSSADSHVFSQKGVGKNASRTMEKEVGNATSACKVLHVLYTPPPTFCKPPTPIFFAKLAELTSKHLFLSGSVNAPPHNQSICIYRRTKVCRYEYRRLLPQDISPQNKNTNAPPQYIHHYPKQTKTAEPADKTEIAT